MKLIIISYTTPIVSLFHKYSFNVIDLSLMFGIVLENMSFTLNLFFNNIFKWTQYRIHSSNLIPSHISVILNFKFIFIYTFTFHLYFVQEIICGTLFFRIHLCYSWFWGCEICIPTIIFILPLFQNNSRFEFVQNIFLCIIFRIFFFRIKV